jgi:lipid A disaccharide synthetase
MYFKCIHGEHLRKEPEMFHSFETTYANALEQLPDAKVFVDYPGAGNTFQSRLKSASKSGDMVLGLLDHVLVYFCNNASIFSFCIGFAR